jgi:PhzF family phenazine biosynthesis protein
MRLWIVDAFAERPFTGNPAAVCVLPEGPWPSGQLLQAIAGEMNLSETAFVRPAEAAEADSPHDWDLRWLTPLAEVRLCGHATLASAHILISEGLADPGPIRFGTLSGVLTAEARPDGTIAMDFPATPAIPATADEADPADGLSDALAAALGARPVAVHTLAALEYLLVELPDEKSVRELTPDLGAVARLPARAVIVTAAADRFADGGTDSAGNSASATGRDDHDFVSRCFGPRLGIPEDPVTGSAHTMLAPFWSARLGRTRLTGLQVSARTGVVRTELAGDRVLLTGRAVTVLAGEARW